MPTIPDESFYYASSEVGSILYSFLYLLFSVRLHYADFP